MSSTAYGVWRYLFLPQKQLEAALAMTTVSLAEMAGALIHPKEMDSEPSVPRAMDGILSSLAVRVLQAGSLGSPAAAGRQSAAGWSVLVDGVA